MNATPRLGIATQPRNAPGTTELWHSGPPPSPGWWPASFRGLNSGLLCFWHAEKGVWSTPAHPRMSAAVAAMCANSRAYISSPQVLWRDRPANWPQASCT
jgi:hypothetical protein